MPSFEFDYENENEWGVSEREDLIINVSRPFEKGKLAEWDNTVPESCNFGISISGAGIDKDKILEFGQQIANTFGVNVHYHRTWIEPGENIKRKIRLHPTNNH